MKLDPEIEKILDKALAGEQIIRQEAVKLLQVDENSPELYAIMSVANTLTRQGGLHYQDSFI
ncbi:hypothetical protein [Desulfofundulus sp.]|uniref:hypothetical protein n=1 Tax=Desulfofundulus sp. TaxID=2282750 RepID=UPI003C7103D0